MGGLFDPAKVPAQVIARFSPADADEWRRIDNNSKARLGKARFLELPGAVDATSDRVRQWLADRGPEASRREC